jgi:N-acetylglucosamine kinase-like BadF-type ATPase
VRAGGWGHLLGDEGSGYDIGVQALRLATQTADGRAQANDVLAAILAHWQLDNPNQLIGYVYRAERTRAEIAALAQPVAALAAAGDGAAQHIMASAAHELARLIVAVGRELQLEQPPVAFGGGLIGALPDLQQAVLDQSGLVLGPARYVEDPAQGALVLAQRLLDTSQ